jgi:ParB family chromosome partitioning protein
VTATALNPRHMASSVEYATPAWLVEPARAVLGGAIDLDPASCALANETVRAARIYTRMDDGLAQPWRGTVFVNPPGGIDADGESRQKAWWFRLAHAHLVGSVPAAVFVSFSIELLQTSQVHPRLGLPLPHDFPICFPARRIPYDRMRRRGTRAVRVTAKQPPHSSMVVFLPPRAGRAAAIERFEERFAPIGRVINAR